MRQPGRSMFPRPRTVVTAAFLLATVSHTVLEASVLDTYRLRWAWSTLGPYAGEAGIVTFDVDEDGRDEMFTSGLCGCGLDSDGAGYWYEVEVGDEPIQVWSSLPGVGRIVRLRAHRSETNDIVVAFPQRIEVFDASTKELRTEFPLAAKYVIDMVVGDLNGDDTVEVVVVDYDDLFVYELESGDLKLHKPGFGGMTLATMTFDDDPQQELLVVGGSFGGFILDGNDWQVDHADLDGWNGMAAPIEATGDALSELVYKNESDLVCVDPRTGEVVWTRAIGSGGFLVSDSTSKSGQLLLASGGSGDSLDVLDPESGDTTATLTLDSWHFSGIGAGNLDEDPGLELVVASYGDYYMYGPDLDVFDVESETIQSRSSDLRGPFFGLSIGDLENDGSLELATVGSRVGPDFYPSAATLIFDLASERLRQVVKSGGTWDDRRSAGDSILAQLDSDPALELCYGFTDYDAGGLACLDGSTLDEEWGLRAGEFSPHGLATAELDTTAFPELVVADGRRRVLVFEGESGWLKWASTEESEIDSQFSTVRFGNVFGDKEPDIVVAGSPTYADGDVATVPASGGALSELASGVVSTVEVVKLAEDPLATIFAGTVSGQVARLDPELGVLDPPIASFGGPILALRAYDVTRDGVQDLVVAASGRVYVFDRALDETVWSSPFLGSIAGEFDSLYVGDFDANSVPEILVNTSVGFAIFDAPLIELFRDGFEDGNTGAWD